MIKIKREEQIEEPDEVTGMLGRILIGGVIFATVCIMLISGAAMYRDTMERCSRDTFSEDLIRKQADPAWRAEQKRLHKKHGRPNAVIYEPGRQPYYINERGQRCRFI